LATTADQFIVIDYYRVLGNIYIQLRNYGDAASAYQAGIVVAENSLSTLGDASKRLQWTAKTEDLYKGLIRVLLQQNQLEDAWKMWEWYKGRSMMASKGLVAVHLLKKLTWMELQPQVFQPVILTEHPFRLVYVTYEDGIEAWTVNRNEI